MARNDNMPIARMLLLYVQIRFSSVRYNPTCNVVKAGDVIKATGGILDPYNNQANVVIKHLRSVFDCLNEDAVKAAVSALGALAKECDSFFRQF